MERLPEVKQVLAYPYRRSVGPVLGRFFGSLSEQRLEGIVSKRADSRYESGRRSQAWLKILNDYWIGPDKAYLCGDRITIADYFGACLITLGDVIRCDFSAYPNVQRWLGNMKQLKSWPKVNEALYGFAEAVRDRPFV